MRPGISPEAQVVAPAVGGRVVVAWIERGAPADTVRAVDFPDGPGGTSVERPIYEATGTLWSLKLESDAEGGFYLAVSESLGSDILIRVLRLDGDFGELDRVQWLSTTKVLPAGRMLDASGHLFLGIDGLTARGRFIEAPSLELDPTFVIQYQINEKEDSYYGSSGDSEIPLIWVTGLDTAVAPDGTGTALYEFGRIRLRRFSPGRRLLETRLLDRAPWTPLIRTGETAVAVSGSETLLAWEWHAFSFVNDRVLAAPSIPAFRAVLADGRLTETVLLEPASQTPDIKDRPAVGLRPDGSGAVAWTERTIDGSRVWLQRLGAGLVPSEPPRLVDDRPGFDADRPRLRGDAEGDLYLSWCATNREDGPDEIGLLDLRQLDLPPQAPRVAVEGGTVRIDWTSPPASTVTLWFSPDLDPSKGVILHRGEALPGERSLEHTPGTPTGFYWLSTDQAPGG